MDGAELSSLPAFASAPWADDLRQEQDRFEAEPRRPGPSGDQTNPDFAGRHTNVTDGERRTTESTCRGCPERSVWIFGGPVAFGTGQRDDHTVASALVALGTADGRSLDVSNFGVPGATTGDELDALEARLSVAEEPPDLVVFIDGLNDALAAYMYASVRDGALLDPIRFDDAWVEEYLMIDPAPEVDAQTASGVARHVAAEYRSVQKRASDLLGPLDVPAVWFLQPDGFVSAVQSEGLARSLGMEPTALAEDSGLARTLDVVEADLSGDVVTIRPAIAALEEPVYADTLHLNEAGALVVAEVVYSVVAEELR